MFSKTGFERGRIITQANNREKDLPGKKTSTCTREAYNWGSAHMLGREES